MTTNLEDVLKSLKDGLHVASDVNATRETFPNHKPEDYHHLCLGYLMGTITNAISDLEKIIEEKQNG